MARSAPAFNWEKVGKGSAVSAPIGAIAVIVWQMMGGYMEDIDKDLDKKADVNRVEAIAQKVTDYGKDIDELRREQVQQGKQLESIDTKQEEVMKSQDEVKKGQDRILDYLDGQRKQGK